jgi:hypothetical protein
MGQLKLTTPTLELYNAMMAGKISYNDFAMLLTRRCAVVASERNQPGQRAEATGKDKSA